MGASCMLLLDALNMCVHMPNRTGFRLLSSLIDDIIFLLKLIFPAQAH